MPSIGVIIPCYNEYERMDFNVFTQFLEENRDFVIYFINDGSTDKTETLLHKICNKLPQQAKIISLTRNIGKGGAIREGLLTALQEQFDYAGYLDADLSTSLNEFKRIYYFIQDHQLDFILASRIKKVDTKISRSLFRHLIGRLIATIIDERFHLGCYDTQCGAKIFKTNIIQPIIKQPFCTTWFFDVEILLRIRSSFQKIKIFEYPLTLWEHKGGSKLNIFSFSYIIHDMVKLFVNYKQ